MKVVLIIVIYISFSFYINELSKEVYNHVSVSESNISLNYVRKEIAFWPFWPVLGSSKFHIELRKAKTKLSLVSFVLNIFVVSVIIFL